MVVEIQELLNQYLKWLRDKTMLRQVKDWIEITTPYLDRHNDYIQIYARKEDGEFLLTDETGNSKIWNCRDASWRAPSDSNSSTLR